LAAVLVLIVRLALRWSNRPNKQRLQPHVIIRIDSLAKVNSRGEIAEFYKAGLSLREIEKRLGIPKTTIRETLLKDGVARRPSTQSRKGSSYSPPGMRSGVTPFGYTYLEGQLVMDPHEYKIVLEILRLSKNGKSIRGIAGHLNDRKLRTRQGKPWNHFLVTNIIQREQKQKKGGPHGTR
jgi:Recombinase